MTEVRKLWRDKASAGGLNPGLSIFSQPRRNHEPPQPYRRTLLFVAAIFTFTMKFIAAIPIILAYGPAIFDLALTGRGVSRPTQTSTTDWALAQFYTIHMGKPSLAIPPTGLGGAALTEWSDHGHNNQDSAVSIWATVHVTPRRALANVGTVITSFNRRRLYQQWRYIRGWWRLNSGRVIEEALIIYFYSSPLLAFILRVWRKRILRHRRLEAETTATLVQPSPILASFVAVQCLVRTDLIQTTQRNVYSSSCIQNVSNIVAFGGTPTPSPFHLIHHLVFDFRAGLRVVSTPTEYPARLIPQQLLSVSTTHTGAVSVYKKIRLGQQVSGAPTASTGIFSGFEAPGSGPNGSNPQRIVIITLVVVPQGFTIIHYEAVDSIAFWTVTTILNPGTSGAPAVSRHASNIYRMVPKRTVTFRTRDLIEAGSSQSEVSFIDSLISRRVFHSNGLALPRTSLAPEIVRVGEPLPSPSPLVEEDGSPEGQRSSARVSPSFISIYSVEGVLVMGCSVIDEVLHWSVCFFPRQGYHISQHSNNDGALLTQSTSAYTTLLEALLRERSIYPPWISRLAGILALNVPGETTKGRLATTEVDITATPLRPSTPDTLTAHAISGVEPEVQVALAPSADTGDAIKVEEAEEEESEDNNLVEAASVPLPPSRPASPEAEEVSEQDEEDPVQATSIPLPDSRSGSPEPHAVTRDSDLRQHIATLCHQYLVLRTMLVRPVLPEEARAIRAGLRPRLCSLESRARERRGLAPLTSVEAEPVGQQQEEVVVEEEAEGEEEEVEEDLEIEPSTEDQDVGIVEDDFRRPFRLVIPVAVVRHISTNIH
ncbi:hypothetical protein FRC04_000561 [Tulasnella sp. 424]|nr:hypothetical protein FRC04_000561 [Tulasnella sp. 424]